MNHSYQCEYCTPKETKLPDGTKEWQCDREAPHPFGSSIAALFPQAKSNTPKKKSKK